MGVFLWFFVDTIQGSANLDAALGLNGGIPQASMVFLFAGGLVLSAYAAQVTLDRSDQSMTFATVAVATLAIGIHGFGEGSAFGAQAAQASGSDVLQAFGGWSAAAGYAGHKLLEPMMAGALLLGLKERRGFGGGVVRRSLVLSLLFSFPSLLGALTGYFVVYDSSFGFAIGSGSCIVAAALLSRLVFSAPRMSGRDSAILGGAVALGFILIYLSALVHY